MPGSPPQSIPAISEGSTQSISLVFSPTISWALVCAFWKQLVMRCSRCDFLEGSNKDSSLICNSLNFISQLISMTIASCSDQSDQMNFPSLPLMTRFLSAFWSALYLSYIFFISHNFQNMLVWWQKIKWRYECMETLDVFNSIDDGYFSINE